MWYGAEITFGNTTEKVTDDKNVFDVDTFAVPEFAYGNRDGHWQKNPEITSESARFVAEYDPDRIVYRSDVAFTVRGVAKNAHELTVDYGTDHNVYEPTAKGFTFVGWYEQQDDGTWKKVEVGTKYELGAEHKETTLEALWVNNLTVSLTKSERSNKQQGGILQLTYYDYAMEAVLSGGKLVGAFADKVTLELTYSFDVYKESGIGSGQDTFGANTVNEFPSEGVIEGSTTHKRDRETPRVHVQIKYIYNGETIYDSGEVTVAGDQWVDA